MPVLLIQPEWLLGNEPDVSQSKLASGFAGNYQTVDAMIKVARQRSGHPLVRNLALKILQVAGVPSQDYASEARAIGRYVQKKVRYVRDPNGIEQLHDPVYLIEKIREGSAQGDCDDMALLIATLLLSIGHQPYYRLIKYGANRPSFQHIYVVVYEKNFQKPKQRIVLDAILKRKPIGTEVPHAEGEEVPV